MNDPTAVTAFVITLNEEDHIRQCLQSVQWTDEILVVDSGSDDDTREIAEEMGARVIHNDWPGMVKQKQFATERASHDLVFNLDADEVVDDELSQSIQNQLSTGIDSETCYEVNRKSKYLGTWITHGSWYPDRIIRLFNRQKTHWEGQDPHAHVKPQEHVERLKGHLLHHPYEDLSDHIDFINRYTTTMAEGKNRDGVKGTIFKALTHGWFKVFRDLILLRGFLDGKAGVVSAIMGGYYTFLKYAKLWEMQRSTDDDS